MPTVNGFNTSQGVLKYNWESLENYNTPDFDSSKTYTLNDYSMYNGKLYKYISAVSSSGEWDSSKWQAVALSDEVKQLFQNDNNLSEDINDINDNIEIIESEMVSNGIIANEFNINSNYSIGDYVFYNNQLYKFTSDHSAGVWDDTDVVVVTLSGELKNVTNNINNLSSDLDETNSNLSDLNTEVIDVKSALNTKAGILRDTVSGSVASFVPDSTVPNLLGLSVALEPIQDLHGYDSPWPAGGGKNLFDGVYRSVFPLHFDVDTEISVSAKPPSSGTPQIAYLDANKQRIDYWGMSAAQSSLSDRVAKTFVLPKEAYYIQFIGAETTEYQIELGNTNTTYSPYSNLCPISGRESVEIGNVGKNKFNINAQDSYSRSGTWYLTNNGDGSITVSLNNNTSIGNKKLKDLCPSLVAGKTYILSAKTTGSNSYIYLSGVNEVWRFGNSKTINERWLNSVVLWYASGANTSATISDIQIEEGSTSSDYEPYQGTIHTISLPETIYGGDIGVVSGDGESLPYYASYNGEPLVGPWISSMDAYAPGATPTVGAQVVDMGGTPTPISTTPTEISTVEGENNVFSPDGDVTVEYAADLKTYIDSKIAAAVAALS